MDTMDTQMDTKKYEPEALLALQKQHNHITQKSIKSTSTSVWATLMKIAHKRLQDLTTLDDTEVLNDITTILNKIVAQIQIDEKLLRSGDIANISDCAIHAPRDTNTKSLKAKPMRQAHYCAERMFVASGRMPKLEWAKMHWQRILATLSRAYVNQEVIKAIHAEEYKTARLLQHQRKGWCALKQRTIIPPIGKPKAMPVEIPPLEELTPFFNHLANDGVMSSGETEDNHLEFTRGAVYPDGRMDLCKQVVGPTWIGNLMTALKTNTKVEHFLLGNNITNLEGGKAIGAYLAAPHPNKIKTWYLAGSDFSSEALKFIVDGFLAASDKDVQSLWLKRNPLYAEGMTHIRRLLESNSSLRILDLHNTAIGLHEKAYGESFGRFEQYLTDNGIRDLCEGLKVNETVENLYIDANALTITSATYLADYFKFKTEQNRCGISKIWIDMNKLGDEGVKILCDALANYNQLKGLNLGSNYISEIGMKYITNAFKHHTGLELLDLGLYKSTADMGAVPNNIGDDGVPDICELIITNKSLRYLNISMNNISSDGMAVIADALELNEGIVYFHYKQYGQEVKQSTVAKIDAIIERNRKIIGGDEFDKEYMRRFIHGEDIWTIDSIYRNSMK